VVRVQTLDDDDKVDGELYRVEDVILEPDSRRTERVVLAPPSTLERVQMKPLGFAGHPAGLPPSCSLPSSSASTHVNYIGRQKVDDRGLLRL